MSEMQDQDSLTQMDRAHLIMEALSLGASELNKQDGTIIIQPFIKGEQREMLIDELVFILVERR